MAQYWVCCCRVMGLLTDNNSFGILVTLFHCSELETDSLFKALSVDGRKTASVEGEGDSAVLF